MEGRRIEKGPPERSATAREALLGVLREGTFSMRELSQRGSLSEREVAEHLPHLERSLRAHGERLVVEAARCLACGFDFSRRARFAPPSRCPACKSERIASPRFRVERDD